MGEIILNSDSDIHSLIVCEKEIRIRPGKPTEKNRNKNQRFLVHEMAGKTAFEVFITQSQRMEEEFSIGLMYNGLNLYRCNGFHGVTKSGYYTSAHHAFPHSHTLTIEDIRNARGQKPSLTIELTGKYVDIETATLYFFEHCGILNYDEYFTTLRQLKLF